MPTIHGFKMVNGKMTPDTLKKMQQAVPGFGKNLEVEEGKTNEKDNTGELESNK